MKQQNHWERWFLVKKKLNIVCTSGNCWWLLNKSPCCWFHLWAQTVCSSSLLLFSKNSKPNTWLRFYLLVSCENIRLGSQLVILHCLNFVFQILCEHFVDAIIISLTAFNLLLVAKEWQFFWCICKPICLMWLWKTISFSGTLKVNLFYGILKVNLFYGTLKVNLFYETLKVNLSCDFLRYWFTSIMCCSCFFDGTLKSW